MNLTHDMSHGPCLSLSPLYLAAVFSSASILVVLVYFFMTLTPLLWTMTPVSPV